MATGKKKRRIAEIERQEAASRKAVEKKAAPVEPETVTTTKRTRATRTPRTRKKG